MNRLAVLLAMTTVLIVGDLQAAPPQSNAEIQAPEIKTPTAGTLAGALSGLAANAGYRGSFSMPFPFSPPEKRGPLLASVLPSYTSEGGISEWGLGWRASLSLQRFRDLGHVGYDDGDDLTGPWGHLVRADDGNWYVQGLPAFVRVNRHGEDYVATTADGTAFVFSGSVGIKGRRGTFSWYLTRVTDIRGHVTTLEYDQETALPSLRRVLYGGYGSAHYRLEFAYETISKPISRLDSGELVTLDRRVAGVAIGVLQRNGTFVTAQEYRLGYEDIEPGQGFFLTSVTRRYASGGAEPPVRFQYGRWADVACSAQFRENTLLDSYLMLPEKQGGRLGPEFVSYIDVDNDGRVDIEHNVDQTTYRQTDQGFFPEPLPPRTPGASRRCRPTFGRFNNPRTLAPMVREGSAYHVVVLEADGPFNTLIEVCDTAGTPLHREVLEGAWEPSGNTRLVDVDGDHQADLVHVYRGGVDIRRNKSGASKFAFGSVQRTALNPDTKPDMSWIHDINGDGIADIVVRHEGGVRVWLGLGNGDFQTEGSDFALLSRGRPLRLAATDQIYFFDANHDGLADILLTSKQYVYLFVNDGMQLVEFAMPALQQPPTLLGDPLVMDLSGTGNSQVAFPRAGKMLYVEFDAPSVGLMTDVDDGKGTRWHLTYQRADAAPGLRVRIPVLSNIEVHSTGAGMVSTQYLYANPTMHQVGKFLVGFDKLETTVNKKKSVATYLNTDTTQGLLVALDDGEFGKPLHHMTSNEYVADKYLGLSYQRAATNHEWWTDDGSGLSTAGITTTYHNYANPFCPRETLVQSGSSTTHILRQIATIANLADIPHCLPRQETIQGRHAEAALDFEESRRWERDSRGQVTRAFRESASEQLQIQTVDYDANSRPVHVGRPDGFFIKAEYDPFTGLLAGVVDAVGVHTAVVQNDDVTDQPQAIEWGRGGDPFIASYRYDEYERLVRTWDNARDSADALPLQSYDYAWATQDTPGRTSMRQSVAPREGIWRETSTLHNAAGEILTTLRKHDATWVAPEFVVEDAGHLRRSTSRPLKPLGPPETLRLEDLVTNSVELSTTSSSPMGYSVAGAARVQGSLRKTVAQGLTMYESKRAVETRENGVLRRVDLFDDAGNIVEVRNGDGTATRFAYDALKRLRRVSAEGIDHAVDYDFLGRPARISRKGIGTLELAYAPRTGLLKQETYHDAQGKAARRVSYEYDLHGRLAKQRHDGAGSHAEYAFMYDGLVPGGNVRPGQAGYLTGIVGPGFDKSFEYLRDGALGRRTVSLRGLASIEEDFEYYADGTLKGRTVSGSKGDGQVIAKYATTKRYDNAGRLSGVAVDSSPLYSVTYDELSRIASAVLDANQALYLSRDNSTGNVDGYRYETPKWGADVAWALNRDGNVAQEQVSFRDVTSTRSYEYTQRHFLSRVRSSDADEAFAYDASGVRQGRETFEVDALGRAMRSAGGDAVRYGAQGDVAEVTSEGHLVSYLYDEAGLRLAKLRDGKLVTASLNGLTVTSTEVVEPVLLAEHLIALLRNGQATSVFADKRGTVLAEGDGWISWPAAFGNRDQHPPNATTADYAGSGYDSDLGWVRLGARDYDPKTGRFTSPDAEVFKNPTACVESPVDCNLYSYARNNPLRYVDSQGAWPDGSSAWDRHAETALRVTKDDPMPGIAAGAIMLAMFAPAVPLLATEAAVLPVVALGAPTEIVAADGAILWSSTTAMVKAAPVGLAASPVAATGVAESLLASLGTASSLTRPLLLKANNEIQWPPHDGFHQGKRAPLHIQTGTLLDRFGNERGTFLAHYGTPYGQRAMSQPSPEWGKYNVYEVLKPLPVEGGFAEPWFGQPGMGAQYKTQQSVGELVDTGYLGRRPLGSRK